jgi:uncharacterized protein (DUF3084 family)
MAGQDAEQRLKTLTAHSLNLLDQLMQARQEIRKLSGGGDSAESLQSQLVQERHRVEQLRQELAQRSDQLAQRSNELARCSNDLTERSNELARVQSALSDLREVDRLRSAAVAELCNASGLPEDSSIGQVGERVRGLARSLTDHQRWVADLLSELTGRRFKLGRRELLDHERRFLEQHFREQA